MFCVTTTPFDFQDALPILSKKESEIETAWRILQPYFGTQIIFGCGRQVSAPNFFDIVAMSVMLELIKSPQCVEEAVMTSICVAEEVALCMDQTETEVSTTSRLQDSVWNCLDAFFTEKERNISASYCPRMSKDITNAILGVFERVYLALAQVEASSDAA